MPTAERTIESKQGAIRGFGDERKKRRDERLNKLDPRSEGRGDNGKCAATGYQCEAAVRI